MAFPEKLRCWNAVCSEQTERLTQFTPSREETKNFPHNDDQGPLDAVYLISC